MTDENEIKQHLFSQTVQLTTALINNIESEEVMRLIASVSDKPAGLLTFDELFSDIYRFLAAKYHAL